MSDHAGDAAQPRRNVNAGGVVCGHSTLPEGGLQRAAGPQRSAPLNSLVGGKFKPEQVVYSSVILRSGLNNSSRFETIGKRAAHVTMTPCDAAVKLAGFDLRSPCWRRPEPLRPNVRVNQTANRQPLPPAMCRRQVKRECWDSDGCITLRVLDELKTLKYYATHLNSDECSPAPLPARVVQIARCTAHRACGTSTQALPRRMGKGGSDSLLLPLSITGAAVVVTLLVFWLWSKRNAGRGSRGTRFTQENGQPVRRSTRWGARRCL